MNEKKSLIFILLIMLIAFIVRFVLLYNNLKNPTFHIQQDNYVDYALSLKKGVLNTYTNINTRLFPGYPIMILALGFIFHSELVAGLFINIAFSLGSIYLFWLLTKNVLATSALAFFPPIWVEQSAKISTEPLTVFLLLLAIILFTNSYFFIAGLIIGLAFDVRLISICLLFTFLWMNYKEKRYPEITKMLLGFAISASILFVYNYWIFGQSGIFKQFYTYYSIDRVSIGVIQIIKDIPRAIDWKQYRILLSGTSYVVLNFLALYTLYKNRIKSNVNMIFFLWMIFSMLFVLSIGPTPMLEEFSRFTVPFVPALIFGLLPLVKIFKKK